MGKHKSMLWRMVTVNVVAASIPLLIVGGLALWAFSRFGDEMSFFTSKTLEDQVFREIRVGLNTDINIVDTLVNNVKNDTLTLASSAPLQNYLAAKTGQSKLWNKIAERQVETTLEGIVRSCVNQQAMEKSTLTKNLKVAERMLAEAGAVGLSNDTHSWDVVNQFSKAKLSVTLPVLSLGGKPFSLNTSFETPTPVVDETSAVVGGVCTLFQRMNDAGDMLRVGTNVKKEDGARAIGTFIPAMNPDGNPNPVVAAIMRKETFVGRAFVVNAWYVTAYKPLVGGDGNVIGMLFVGIKEQEANANIMSMVKTTKIGDTGCVFVVDPQGVILVHPEAEMVGKSILAVFKQAAVKDVLNQKEAGKFKTVAFERDNDGSRSQFVTWTYFPEWNWIICAAGCWEELSKEGFENAKLLLAEDILKKQSVSEMVFDGKRYPCYNQIRFLDATGAEIVVAKDGVLATELGTRAGVKWFEDVAKLKAGEKWYSSAHGLVDLGIDFNGRHRSAVPIGRMAAPGDIEAVRIRLMTEYPANAANTVKVLDVIRVIALDEDYNPKIVEFKSPQKATLKNKTPEFIVPVE